MEHLREHKNGGAWASRMNPLPPSTAPVREADLSDSRVDEVPALLAPAYDLFSGGFSTADLKEANVLLDDPA